MTTVTSVTGWVDTFAVAMAAPENRCKIRHSRARIIVTFRQSCVCARRWLLLEATGAGVHHLC
jgi:hypothetical protein